MYIGTLCRVEECRKKLLKKDLSEHMESCPYKRVDCLMCHAKVQKSQLSVRVCFSSCLTNVQVNLNIKFFLLTLFFHLTNRSIIKHVQRRVLLARIAIRHAHG